jgi:hypothetical protein
VKIPASTTLPKSIKPGEIDDDNKLLNPQSKLSLVIYFSGIIHSKNYILGGRT